eukprot:TRINITY_DN2656_c0_g1_i5.p1 TRINITY_DN2656_c0_g1~~TRINITY_DN2656_c0_g1_i5.p1  ORF type:complete len:181 (-),score=24.16 TRINITY_DN2656_c0_g1_i5:14-556(-)
MLWYYACATLYGWHVPADKPWVPASLVRTYYVISLGCALQALVRLLMTERHRDFLEMFMHHLLECALLVLSYLYGHVRVGSLVLAAHDPSDVFVNLARCANDARRRRTTMALFAALPVSWLYFLPALRIPCAHHLLVAYREPAREFVAGGDDEGLSGCSYLVSNGCCWRCTSSGWACLCA